jgi:hypothetical protein
MGKTRVHLLAKELGVETKDLIAQLDRLGIRGRKAQSSLEDDEVVRLRAAFAAQEKPHVHVGEEKVVADRVVTAEDESLGEIHARETIVERRVRANVIRRRTSRVEVPSEMGDRTETQPEVVTAPMEEPSPIEESVPAPLSPEEDSALSATVPEIEMLPEEGISVIPEEELVSRNTDTQEEMKSPPAAEPPPAPAAASAPPPAAAAASATAAQEAGLCPGSRPRQRHRQPTARRPHEMERRPNQLPARRKNRKRGGTRNAWSRSRMFWNFAKKSCAPGVFPRRDGLYLARSRGKQKSPFRKRANGSSASPR